MITLRQTRQEMDAARWHWLIPLMDFVDDFRHYQRSTAIAEPFEKGDDRMDAILAATAETLCREMDLPIPDWILEVPACREPWFPSGLENLKAIALVESPLPFRIRKIFVLENFLTRV